MSASVRPSSPSEPITSHIRRERGRSTRLDHYPDAAQAFVRFTPQLCMDSAAAMGPAIARLVRERLTVHALHNLREVQAIVRLCPEWITF